MTPPDVFDRIVARNEALAAALDVSRPEAERLEALERALSDRPEELGRHLENNFA